MNTNKKSHFCRTEYICEECNYRTGKKSDFNKHILTAKHKILTNTNEKSPKALSTYKCVCGKEYKHGSSLCNHRKNCTTNFLFNSRCTC